ncbi:MAG: L-threonylcarbamoyladenylate synthase [Oscillospiraceae bacterium]|nr:L-threonylcarbamoyladenylate synthase [Oscillospiraceae bacterium]
MKTLYLRAEDQETPAIAARLILEGKLVAIPTETVYGLGANALDPAAALRIFEAKGRPQDNPLIIHIADPADLDRYCHDIPESARMLAARFWPGPLTMVLPVRDNVPKRTTAGLDTVAIRCPEVPVTREIIRLAGVPVAAPSANLSGTPSTTTAAHVLHDYGMDGKIAAVVDGGPCRVGVESTIVDLHGPQPSLLRPGGVTPEQLRAVLGELAVDRAVVAPIDGDAVVRAPGMKYKHYAPKGAVMILRGSAEAAAAYVRAHAAAGMAVLCYEEELPLYRGLTAEAYGREADPESLAHGLFAALRDMDEAGYETIYARCPEGGGVGCAVRNRLSKAAGFHILEV